MRTFVLCQIALVASGCGDGHVTVAPSSTVPDAGAVTRDFGVAPIADAGVAASGVDAGVPDQGVPPLDGGAAAADAGSAPGDGGTAVSACTVQPKMLAPVVVPAGKAIVGFAADDRNVYFAIGDTATAQVWSLSSSGGMPRPIGTWSGHIPTEKTNFANMTIDSAHVFFGNQVSVVQIAKDGSAQQELLTAGYGCDEPLAPQCLGASDGFVYWCDGCRSTLLRAPVDGGQSSIVAAPVGAGEGQTIRLAFDSANTYVTKGTEVLRIAGGNGPAIVATTVTQPPNLDFDLLALGLAVDDRNIYIVVGSGYPVFSSTSAIEVADKHDGASARILQQLDGYIPGGLISDGDHLYWSGVWRMNKDGRGLVHLVDAGPFAVSGDSLYFIHDDAIWRMCK